MANITAFPNKEEGTITAQRLNQMVNECNKVDNKIDTPNGGTIGQILAKTADGNEYIDIPTGGGGDVTIVNDFTTGGAENVASGELAKILKEEAINETNRVNDELNNKISTSEKSDSLTSGGQTIATSEAVKILKDDIDSLTVGTTNLPASSSLTSEAIDTVLTSAGAKTLNDKISTIIKEESITFTTGIYNNIGDVHTNYSGNHAEIQINEAGIYIAKWSFSGSVRHILAINNTGDVLKDFTNDVNTNERELDIPEGTTKLLASTDTSTIGTLIKIKTAKKDTGGIITENRITEIINKEAPVILAPIINNTVDDGINQIKWNNTISDEAPHIVIMGNLWVDNTWKNTTNEGIITKIYNIEDGDVFDIFYDPKYGSYDQALSSVSIKEQPLVNSNANLLLINESYQNNLDSFRDDIFVNEERIRRKTITGFTFPLEAKSLIILQKMGGNDYSGNIRVYKRKGAKGVYSDHTLANKKIAILGDSVSQNNESEIGKEKLRNLLNCKVDTYGVGGSGWAINAYASWVFTNNTSGVYQALELAKESSETYDIYCLSCTLNDSITHQKDIGDFDFCKPYLKNEDSTDNLTDVNLDTMIGGLNFSIQKIYEKNPNAEIILATMNKCFLPEPKSGYGLTAGYDPFNTDINIKGKTYYNYVEAVRKLGEIWSIKVVDVYKEGGINEFNHNNLMNDQYHPNEEGYKRIWNLWFNTIIK